MVLTVNRDNVLENAARDLEFGVHQLVSSAGGYRDRGAARVKAVKTLTQREAVWSTDSGPTQDEEAEETREIVELVRQVCQRIIRRSR